MNPVSIQLPPGADVYNFLYPTKDPEYLVQDLLVVGLPNGYCIDVGWVPEHDPNGDYMISVFYEYGNRQQMPPVITKNLSEAVEAVQYLAQHFNRQPIPVPSSSFSTSEIRCAVEAA